MEQDGNKEAPYDEVSLMSHETILGQFTNQKGGCWPCCCFFAGGGNTLTITDRRIVIKYWEDMCGCCEALMQEESFMQKDLHHITLNAGRKKRVLHFGLLCLVTAVAAFVVGAIEGGSELVIGVGAGVAFLLIGVYLLFRFFFGNRHTFVTLDFAKPLTVGSWSSNGGIFGGLRALTSNGAYTVRELALKREDARAAASLLTSKVYGSRTKRMSDGLNCTAAV